MKSIKVKFKKPSKSQYIMTFPATFLTLIKHIFALVFYYYVNFVLGRKKAKIGKNSKVHPTVVLRQAERIKIGDNCLINHNNVLQAATRYRRESLSFINRRAGPLMYQDAIV